MSEAAAAAAATSTPAAAPAAAAASSGSAAGASGPATGGSPSLFVADLDPSINEAMLYQHFVSQGFALTSLRICRDQATRMSLGYGYINFASREEAQRALDEMNYEPLNGKPIRLMWSQRDPSKRRSGVGNIFISGLNPSIDSRQLLDTFSTVGPVLSCKVATDPAGNSRGFGFVHFENPKDAEKAINTINEKEIAGMIVKVAPFKTRKQRMEEQARIEREFNNVFVKNLPDGYTEEQLKELFGKFGPIDSLKLAMDDSSTPPKSKGFGFVKFENSADARAAVAQLNQSKLEDKELYVGRAMSKSERADMLRRQYEQRRAERSKNMGGNLYIKNLDESVTDDKLREMFEEFGTITSTKVERTSDGVSKGFGYVCFSTREEATKAVTEMMGRMVPGNSKPLFVVSHESKEERRIRLEKQMQQQQQQQATQVQQMGMRMPMAGNMYGAPMMYYGGMMPVPATAPGQRPYVMLPGAVAMGAPQQPRMMLPANMAAGGYRPPMPNAPAAGQDAKASRGRPAAAGGMTAAELENKIKTMDPQAQKNYIGEIIYPRVQVLEPGVVGKVTGMLLEQPVKLLVQLIENEALLRTQVAEAVKVLKQQGLYKGAS